MNMDWLVLRLAGTVVLLSLALPATAADLPVAPVSKETVKHEQRFDGVLEAVRRSTVSAETSGRIEELPFDVDDYVPKGEVIVRFRNAEQQARLESARAAVEEARAQVRQTESEYRRMKELLEQDTVSESAFERAESAYESSRARLESAQGQLALSEEQLERTVVRAPYSGVVTERHVEVGEAAQPGTPLMTGLSLEHLRAVVDVPQRHINPLREHEEARVHMPDGSSLEARELDIFPYADEDTHTFRVRADLPQGQHGAYPGMLVKVSFTTGTEEVLLVPAEAVVRRSELTAVYVQREDGSLTLRQIRAGRDYDDRVQVLAGLQAGEQVVLDPTAAGIAYKNPAEEAD